MNVHKFSTSRLSLTHRFEIRAKGLRPPVCLRRQTPFAPKMSLKRDMRRNALRPEFIRRVLEDEIVIY